MARSRTPLTSVISSLAEANEVMVKIGAFERDMAVLVTAHEEQVALLREATNQAVAPLEKERDSLVKSLQLFADMHRDALLVGEKKSVILPGGEFGWRLPPTKVTFGKGGAEKAILTITAMGLTQYLRYAVEVDREALLRDRPQVPGVKFSQKENFYVKPESGKMPETFPGVVAVLVG